MAKKKRKKPTGSPMRGLNPKTLIQQKARKYPVYECRITNEGAEGGKYQIMVARQKPNGRLIVGFFLIDKWCLGLKDTFYRHDVYVDEYEEMVESISANEFDDVSSEKCEPNHAFNLIYGAIEYAEDLGFQPPKDFAVTEYILPDVEEVVYEEIEFGKDGKPFYLSGPDDNAEAIIAKLEKAVGRDNFNTIVHLPEVDDFEMADARKAHLGTEMVEQKTMMLPEEFKADFMFQILLCGFIGEELDWQYHELKDCYNEDFQDDILDRFEDALLEMREMDGLPPLEQPFEQELFLPMLRFTVGKIIETGGVGFMFEKDYLPFMLTHLQDYLDQMSEQEMMDFQQTLTHGMTPSELLGTFIKNMVTEMIFDRYGENIPAELDGTFREEALGKVKEKLNEVFEENPFDSKEDFNDFCAESVEEVMETIHRLRGKV